MDIDTDCIVSFELIERDKLRRYIENPYLYSRVQHSENMQLEQRGITIVKSDLPAELLKEQIIWEKKNNNRYITFLMKEEITEGFPNDLQRAVADDSTKVSDRRGHQPLPCLCAGRRKDL